MSTEVNEKFPGISDNTFTQSSRSLLMGFLKKRKWLLFAALLSTLVIIAPSPEPVDFLGRTIELSRAGQNTLGLLSFLVVVFITDSLPVGLALPLMYVWIALGGIMSVKDASTIFASDATWFLLGALMLAQILLKYDIHKKFLILLFKLVGGRSWSLIFGLAFGSALLSSVISDHAVVSFLLPVVIAFIASSGGIKKIPNFSRCLLFGVTYGAALGGLMTPSGGGRNLIMLSLLEQNFNTSVSFGAWVAMAAPVGLIIIPLMIFWLLFRFKPEVKNISEEIEKMKVELAKEKMRPKQWLVLTLYLGTVAAFILSGDAGIGMISLASVLVFFALGLVDWEDLEKVNWGVILLYFGAIGFGTALSQSGAAEWLAGQIIVFTQDIIPFTTTVVTFLAVSFMTIFTEFMSDGPAVASTGPVFLEIAKLLKIDPIIVGVATAISSSFAFVLIIATPANAIAYGTGYLKAKDFVKAGLGVAIICWIVLMLVVKFWWIDVLGVGINGFH